MNAMIHHEGKVFIDLEILLNAVHRSVNESTRVAEETNDPTLAAQVLGIIALCTMLEACLDEFKKTA